MFANNMSVGTIIQSLKADPTGALILPKFQE